MRQLAVEQIGGCRRCDHDRIVPGRIERAVAPGLPLAVVFAPAG